VKDLLLIVGSALRNELRWARQHLYYLLVLAPLVLGFGFLTVDWAVADLPPVRPGQWTFFAGAVVFFLALFIAGLSRAAAEVYHVGRPESVFETFPIGADCHLGTALALRTVRAVVIVMLIFLARWRFAGIPITPLEFGAGFIFAVILALTEIMCGLVWIRWNHLRRIGAVLVALVCALTSASLGGDLFGKLFLPSLFSAHRLPLFTAILAAWSLVLLVLLWRVHRKWRRRDIEFALRLGSAGTRGFQWGSAQFNRFGPTVAALLRRDLSLVVRVFSSAVYVAGAMLLLLLVLLFVVNRSGAVPLSANPYGWVGGTWLIPVLAVKAACVIGCLVVMAIVPVLVSYQLPHLWLERSVGVRGQELWTSKLYLTRLVTIPVPVLVWLVGVLAGAAPGYYIVPLLLECIWIWWMMTTLVGSLSFEIPDRPGLALLLMNLVGFGVGMFIAWLWPVGIVAYVMGSIRGLRDRGIARAGYCLLVGES
jgi:hypothetical protein